MAILARLLGFPALRLLTASNTLQRTALGCVSSQISKHEHLQCKRDPADLVLMALRGLLLILVVC